LDIPVFHDDQHGTAIIAAAGLINALHLTGRSLSKIKMVVNGAGAASISCVELLKTMGLPQHNVVLCDTKGVIYRARTDGLNQRKSAHAVETNARSLAEAIAGADVFFGLSAKGAVDQAMVASMANKPIIFAMANPDPEITPEEVRAVRSDAIIATGRRLPEPGQQRPGLPLHLSWRPRRAHFDDQRRDEDRRGRGLGRARPPGRAGRGRRRLFRSPA